MRSRSMVIAVCAVILAFSSAALLVGCNDSNESGPVPTGISPSVEAPGQGQGDDGGDGPDIHWLDDDTMAFSEPLSSFQSKDPFISQAVTSTETSEPSGGGTSPGSDPSSTTTTSTAYHPGPSPVYPTSSTTTTVTVFPPTVPPFPTSSTSSTTSTTTLPPHTHMLTVVAVEMIDGEPMVSLKVDDQNYPPKKVGEVISTTWGEVKVVDINAVTKTVTLLHGSETLVMTVGQYTYE